ncbi:MAG TPA: HAMP domain-containing sensor histidine kinase [Rhizomicrobium sp.]|nr:HAMP domain-containing sensor histidine kinase [Rhizomicrobium sp.]
MKRGYSVSTLLSLVTGALVVVLVTAITAGAMSAYKRERDSTEIMSSARMANDIVMVRDALRAELGFMDTIVRDPNVSTPQALEQFKQAHKKSLAVIDFVEREIAVAQNEKMPPGLADSFRRIAADFDRNVFPAVLKAGSIPVEDRPRQLINDPTVSVLAMLALADKQSAILSREIASDGPYMSEMMRISDIVWRVRGEAGGERRVYADLITRPHPPTRRQLEDIARVEGRIGAPWEAVKSPQQDIEMPPLLTRTIAEANQSYFVRYAAQRRQVLERLSKGEPVGFSSSEWMGLSTVVLNSLMRVSRAALECAQAKAAENLANARHELLMALMYMLFCIALSILTGFLVSIRIIRPLKQITHAITSNHDEGIDRVLALSSRGDEIGQFALALKTFRRIAADRQRLESELVKNQAAKDAAEAASRIKSEFLANMSHELRTPLNAVIGFSELMLHKTFGPLSERYAEYARLINESGTHLLSLVSDILDLAKIEAGRFQADFRDFDLKGCAEECLPLVRHRADENQLTLCAELPDAAVRVIADPRACKQIMLNLLSNAVKFSRSGGRVTLSLAEDGESVRFSVSDEGIGIAPDVLERIGQPFEQASNNPMLAREGTGLGLSVVRALVNEHGGEMDVQSREGVGTTITIILPRMQERRRAA